MKISGLINWRLNTLFNFHRISPNVCVGSHASDILTNHPINLNFSSPPLEPLISLLFKDSLLLRQKTTPLVWSPRINRQMDFCCPLLLLLRYRSFMVISDGIKSEYFISKCSEWKYDCCWLYWNKWAQKSRFAFKTHCRILGSRRFPLSLHSRATTHGQEGEAKK